MTDCPTARPPHRQICGLCHDVCRIDFWVPDETWRLALHESQWGEIVCLDCFARLAEIRRVDWSDEIELYPMSLVAHTDWLRVTTE